jgi:DNA-binding MarR family transcriptional regulator
VKVTSARTKPTSAADREAADPGRLAWHFLLELAPHLKAHFAGLAAEFDLTPPQALALRRLEPSVGVPMNHLAEVLLCDASNVTGIVDKLEGRGFIERQAVAGDRRVKVIALTPAGIKLRERFLERVVEPMPAIAGLSASDQKQLAQILERACAIKPG